MSRRRIVLNVQSSLQNRNSEENERNATPDDAPDGQVGSDEDLGFDGSAEDSAGNSGEADEGEGESAESNSEETECQVEAESESGESEEESEMDAEEILNDQDQNASADSEGSGDGSEGEGDGDGEGDGSDEESKILQYAHRSLGKVYVSRQRKTEEALKRLHEMMDTFEPSRDEDGRVVDNETTFVIRTGEVTTARRKVKGVLQKQVKEILELCLARENLYLYGPTGSGKSFLAEKVAEGLDLPFFAQSCSQGMDETVITGRILPNEDGNWVYHKTKFVEFYEFGGIYCLDEGDKADPNLLTFLNTALSNDYFYNELDGGRKIARHPDFIMIITANTAGHGGSNSYFGEELDLSTLRRFQTGMVEVGYDTKLEKRLLEDKVFLWGQIMRKVLDKNSVDRLVVSTGFLLKVNRLANEFGWDRKRWEKTFFAGRSKDEVKRLKKDFDYEVESLSSRVEG